MISEETSPKLCEIRFLITALRNIIAINKDIGNEISNHWLKRVCRVGLPKADSILETLTSKKIVEKSNGRFLFLGKKNTISLLNTLEELEKSLCQVRCMQA